MRVVIAPDSFKHALSAVDTAAAIAAGVRRAAPAAECVLQPMADGGEGTVLALCSALGGELRTGRVTGASGQPIEAAWAWLADGTAIIEVAAAAGLQEIAREALDAPAATTRGVGEQIRAALDAGARRVWLGLGGSATTDGGAGLLQALGVRLLDGDGRELPMGGGALSRLARVDASGLDPRLADTTVTLISDVDNPLCGARGAAAVFGPQKGADPAQVAQLDAALAHYADRCAQALGVDRRDAPGAGAAGGVGYAALAFLGAQREQGIAFVARVCGLAQAIEGAAFVITGEGRLDAQTLHGKTPAGVARLAQAAGVPCFALAGALGDGYQALYDAGIAAAFALAPSPVTLDEALPRAGDWLADRACDLTRVWLAARSAAA
ncbi:glycerate kinase [Verticiella sediminum]|uniref:Glycerate kinase n=1 Tax=Verticiella sediminum TaxID=1247510 RepID=A0A556ANJ9_9BURK|nr:glycerate kinase [Verticiella sediminum]TSH94455.1 glycerate kinase [Verticiella sediminum]